MVHLSGRIDAEISSDHEIEETEALAILKKSKTWSAIGALPVIITRTSLVHQQES